MTALPVKSLLPPCPRCQGRMLPAPDAGDLVCFSCGHIAYAAPILPFPPGGERRTSHGGKSLN